MKMVPLLKNGRKGGISDRYPAQDLAEESRRVKMYFKKINGVFNQKL